MPKRTTYFFEKVVLIISKLTEICCCCSQLQVSGCQKGVIFGQSSKCPKMPLSPHLPKQNQLVTGDGIKDLILLPRTNVKKCALRCYFAYYCQIDVKSGKHVLQLLLVFFLQSSKTYLAVLVTSSLSQHQRQEVLFKIVSRLASKRSLHL